MAGISRFVPEAPAPPQLLIQNVQKLLDECTRFCVLTGAGLSTESGIPDYRSAKVGQFARTPHRPIQHQEFMSSEYFRRRFWSRNFVAYPRFSSASPNISHRILAEWEKSPRFQSLITQNVDDLHGKAGSRRLIELHGNALKVVCMDCGSEIQAVCSFLPTLHSSLPFRSEIQEMITSLNPKWTVEEIGEMAPDGDVSIPDKALLNFRTPYCESCGERSILSGVVSRRQRARQDVERCYAEIEQSDLLLVFGSSLTVMSGYRFAYFAAHRKQPVVIVNIGNTRGDDLATVKIQSKCSEVLQALRVE
ncbi:Deacetylase sirtuin-type domain-containing protein [Aphelenchoides fujianensis]|nr:Deacetylase sirtuin-type domain-containing protein [Aphelenchoides fujianensis]